MRQILPFQTSRRDWTCLGSNNWDDGSNNQNEQNEMVTLISGTFWKEILLETGTLCCNVIITGTGGMENSSLCCRSISVWQSLLTHLVVWNKITLVESRLALFETRQYPQSWKIWRFWVLNGHNPSQKWASQFCKMRQDQSQRSWPKNVQLPMLWVSEKFKEAMPMATSTMHVVTPNYISCFRVLKLVVYNC